MNQLAAYVKQNLYIFREHRLGVWGFSSIDKATTYHA